MSLVKWESALRRQWEPLGRMPETEAEAAALGLHHGLTDWSPRSRPLLLADSVKGDRKAFVTLACHVWPHDKDMTKLPKELQLIHEGRELAEQTAFNFGGQNPANAILAA